MSWKACCEKQPTKHLRSRVLDAVPWRIAECLLFALWYPTLTPHAASCERCRPQVTPKRLECCRCVHLGTHQCR